MSLSGNLALLSCGTPWPAWHAVCQTDCPRSRLHLGRLALQQVQSLGTLLDCFKPCKFQPVCVGAGARGPQGAPLPGMPQPAGFPGMPGPPLPGAGQITISYNTAAPCRLAWLWQRYAKDYPSPACCCPALCAHCKSVSPHLVHRLAGSGFFTSCVCDRAGHATHARAPGPWGLAAAPAPKHGPTPIPYGAPGEPFALLHSSLASLAAC